MNLTNEQFNLCIAKYKEKVSDIAKKYNYPSNVTHTLYVVVPAFIFKYGFKYENFILKMFEDVKIIVKDRQDKIYQASFYRELKYEEETYKSNKYIFLYNYQNTDLTQMLDNLIHEFNHAVNSLNNEIRCDESYVYLRTGLTYLKYNRATLKPIEKQEDIVLEEIINTRQTEELMNIITSFSKYEIIDSEISNIIYTLKQTTGSTYRSKAYYLQSAVCRNLLENRTFIHTLENLRYQGEVSDIKHWFDTIVGKEGSFNKVNNLLYKILETEKELVNVKFFKNSKINKIKSLSMDLFNLVELFNNNCNYK